MLLIACGLERWAGGVDCLPQLQESRIEQWRFPACAPPLLPPATMGNGTVQSK